jgi:hypothetical protein
MESIRITIHKLDFFDNITKVGRIVIYEFTTPFTVLRNVTEGVLDRRLARLRGLGRLQHNGRAQWPPGFNRRRCSVASMNIVGPQAAAVSKACS